MHQIRSVDTTGEILRELGARLRGYRLQQNVTTAELALRAGIGIATAARAETGRNTSVETLVKILRALGRLDALDAILPPPLVSPIQLAARQGHQRRRARARRVLPTAPPTQVSQPASVPLRGGPGHR
jgi:transcriptional regulator with XRE-family HTH domain